MFIDKARIYVTAGRGGAGCSSFRREKFVPLGGPDGGNGGKGGDVYLVADPHMSTLLDLTYRPHYRAQDGNPGQSANKYGRGAHELVIRLPLGTVVYKNGEAVADLKTPGEKILIAKGGRGGRGNAAFKTSRHTAPRVFEKGEPGEDIILELELKLIADIGLVGFPNAGKSTFLARTSAARPKIADYPFTTLSPNLGVVTMGEKNFVVADIPGLIEGAHEGRGLGDDFLRHIQRTRTLIHIIDIFGFDNKTAYQNYVALNKELSKYSKALAKKPAIIAVNKMDLTGSKEKLLAFKKKLKGKKVFAVSAVSGEGIKEVLIAAFKAVEVSKEEISVFKEGAVKKYVYEPEFSVERIDDVFIISGKKIEKLAAMTDFANYEALVRFDNILKKLGVDKILKEKGITPGCTVKIGEHEYIYED
ncbi:MAG TPA: GTPase ObgE [Elusimicrobia bacterium]|nr:MAG: GTPase ObgE [Elusimicrobia bacterium RIFOXYA12_FULL_49_49]OGS14622.1 MAG: GTPase ObgE [Elusimicrobia bacterium RIFOXYA2_FULL_47_53]OGS25725.1 MAG: GTPase ObgE [Elusimicrobia bacterium RIFOXYB12_FULL_50_12]OGS31713.1 MAG: GTPase ObgE [Elusimicrobia bacterium RIFOXYB2_FULL_46_23]HBU69760.1 GTPase ObgE [Elusimicrobiota bacterium]